MDKEKVVKTLIDALTAKENYPWAKAEMSFEFIEMLLELLKAQRETIDELISADKALKQLKEQEAKAGTWQWKIHGKAESGGTLGEAICDQCGKSTYATAVKGDLNYCPNCGAKMKQEGRRK